jgi:hypothetical protein
MPTDDITARLATLERAHRRLRRLVGVLILALLATFLVGAATDGVLVGRTLKLLDEQGRVRVLVSASTGISFVDTKGRTRGSLGLDGEGAPGLVLNGDASRAVLNVNRDGPALTLIGDRGALRAILALVSDQPGLAFFDGEEHERARIGVVDGNGRAFVRGADGGMTWRAPNHD